MFDVPGEWKWLRLQGTALEEPHGFDDGDWIEAAYITDKGIRLIQTGNIGEGEFLEKPDRRRFISLRSFQTLNCKWVHPSDILISRLADPVGRACRVPNFVGDCVTAVDCTIYRPDPGKADSNFVLQWLNSRWWLSAAADLAGGSTRKRISRRNLGRLLVPVPPVLEQIRIADILDTVDAAIRRTEEVIAKLELVKKGLLHDLLTRGIDENGELRDPERHPEQFKESELGRIPRGWRVRPLAEVVPSAVYGISSSLGAGSGIPVLRMNNFKDGEAELSDLKYSNSSDAHSLLLRTGDVLFNRTNSIDHVGRTGIWRGQLERASFASYLVRLEFNPEELTGEFLNLWLNWEVTQQRIRRVATPGVHQVNINPTNLRKTRIAVPVLVEQDAIARGLARLAARCFKEIAVLEKLRLLKKALMDDLLTGKVRVTPLLEKEEVAVSEAAE